MATTGICYRITGADKHTGKNVELIFEATDEKDALRQASERGVFVLSCSPQPHPAAKGRSSGVASSSNLATSTGSSRGRLSLLAIIVIAFVLVGGLGFVLWRGSAGTASEAKLAPFRTALFKMRADLKLGMSDKEYVDNLKSLQLASDQAASGITPAESALPAYKTLQSAFDEYMAAYQCIKTQESGLKAIPEYAPVAALDAKIDEKKERLKQYDLVPSHGMDDYSRMNKLRLEMAQLSMEANTVLDQVTPAIVAFTLQLQQSKQKHWDNAADLLDSLNKTPKKP